MGVAVIGPVYLSFPARLNHTTNPISQAIFKRQETCSTIVEQYINLSTMQMQRLNFMNFIKPWILLQVIIVVKLRQRQTVYPISAFSFSWSLFSSAQLVQQHKGQSSTHHWQAYLQTGAQKTLQSAKTNISWFSKYFTHMVTYTPTYCYNITAKT